MASRPLQCLSVTVYLVLLLVTMPCGHGPLGCGAKLLTAACSVLLRAYEFWGTPYPLRLLGSSCLPTTFGMHFWGLS